MNEQVKNNLLSFTLIFLVAFLLFKAFGPLPILSTENPISGLQVTGEGKASVKPDSATVTASVSTTGATQTEVQTKINTVLNAVIAAENNIGIDKKDMQSTNYNVTPNYDYSSGSQVQKGFQATTTLTIKVKNVDNVGKAIDAATQAGATNVNNNGFTSTDTASAQDQARKVAITQAKQKAQTIANNAGFRLGRIVSYKESQSGTETPLPLFRGLSATETQPTVLQPGSNEVDITVTLDYELR